MAGDRHDLPDPPPWAEAWFAGFDDDDPEVRRAAVIRVRLLGQSVAAPWVAAFLVDYLPHESQKLRQAAYDELRSIALDQPEAMRYVEQRLLQMMTGDRLPDAHVFPRDSPPRMAANLLREAPPDARALAQLMAMLETFEQDPLAFAVADFDVVGILAAMHRQGADVTEAMPLIVKLHARDAQIVDEDTPPADLGWFNMLIAEFGPLAADAAPALITLIEEEAERRRFLITRAEALTAAEAMAAIGEAAAELAPRLRAVIAAREEPAGHLWLALARLDPADAEARQRALAFLDEHPDRPAYAVLHWQISGDQEALAERLGRLLADDEARWRAMAAIDAFDLRHPSWLPILMDDLPAMANEPWPPDDVAMRIRLIGRHGEHAAETVPLLTAMLDRDRLVTPGYRVMREAALALGEFGEAAKPALDQLRQLHTGGLAPWWDAELEAVVERIEQAPPVASRTRPTSAREVATLTGL